MVDGLVMAVKWIGGWISDGGEMVDGLVIVVRIGKVQLRLWNRDRKEERKIRARNGNELGYNYQIQNEMTLMPLLFEPVELLASRA